jgi:hypothetical protein
VEGHKSYYYNVFDNAAAPFEKALKIRKEEESNAVAIRAFAGMCMIFRSFELRQI